MPNKTPKKIKAVYIPPKLNQSFFQGGTFVFDGTDTVFAHYDESTGAHSDIDQVMQLAKKRKEQQPQSPSEKSMTTPTSMTL